MDGRVLAMEWRVKRGHVFCSNYLIFFKIYKLAVGGLAVYWPWMAVYWSWMAVYIGSGWPCLGRGWPCILTVGGRVLACNDLAYCFGFSNIFLFLVCV